MLIPLKTRMCNIDLSYQTVAALDVNTAPFQNLKCRMQLLTVL